VLGSQRALCFLHIAKTGGTSLTDALARLYAPERVFSDRGNLSVAYLDSLGARLNGGAFLAGHAAQGVAAALQGRADMITLLRNPVDQAVSNYLHVLSEPHNALHADALRLSFKDYLRRHDDQIDYQARSLALALGVDAAESEAIRLRPGALTGFLESLAFIGVMERLEACADLLSRRLPGEPALRLGCMNAAVCRGVSTRTLARLRQAYQDLREDTDLAPVFAREARLYARAERLLSRLETEHAGFARARVHAASAGHISAAWFHTEHGVTRGPTVVAPLNGGGRHLIHGPYARLAPGHYQAAFCFRLESPSAPLKGRIKIEAVCNGNIHLRRRWINTAARAGSAAPAIHFTHASAQDVLEFRIRARGFNGGRLIFEGVTITPTSAARAWPSRVWRALSMAWRRARAATGVKANDGALSR
jgi:hypothetical protein